MTVISGMGQLSSPHSFLDRRDHLNNKVPHKVVYSWLQPAGPMKMKHGDTIGELLWWGRGKDCGDLLVFRLTDEDPPLGRPGWRDPHHNLQRSVPVDDGLVGTLSLGEWWLSPTVHVLPVGSLQLIGGLVEETSLTDIAATGGIRPVVLWEGDIVTDSRKPAGLDPPGGVTWGSALTRAHKDLSAARFRYRPSHESPYADPDVERMRQAVSRLLHPSEWLKVVNLDAPATSSTSSQTSPTSGNTSALHRRGTSGVRFDGQVLSDRLGQKVMELLDLNTPLEDIATYVHSHSHSAA